MAVPSTECLTPKSGSPQHSINTFAQSPVDETRHWQATDICNLFKINVPTETGLHPKEDLENVRDLERKSAFPVGGQHRTRSISESHKADHPCDRKQGKCLPLQSQGNADVTRSQQQHSPREVKGHEAQGRQGSPWSCSENNETEAMNQMSECGDSAGETGATLICAVCGDKASGNFFGATVCLPCKVSVSRIYISRLY